MSWKKYFTPVNTENQSGSYSPISGGGRPGPARSNYSSYLPDVYAGSPNRIEKYMQYDTMDMDSEVNAALDILAEFCTGKDKENATPFHCFFRNAPTGVETKLIKEALQKWCKIQFNNHKGQMNKKNLWGIYENETINVPFYQPLINLTWIINIYN